MKKYLRIILISCFCISLLACNSKKQTTSTVTKVNIAVDTVFKNIDEKETEHMNAVIAANGLKSGEEIIAYYMPKQTETEGNYTYDISKQEISVSETEITAVADGLMDDSMKGRKVVMLLKNENGLLKIVSIKEAYKCYPGRGHENWSPVSCN
jgi:hypothetical protein